MADPIASLSISAQGWLDEERRDPGSEISKLLQDIAVEVADTERILAPVHFGELKASIHIDEVRDSDGFIEEHDASERLVTYVLNSSSGYIRNRHSKNVKRRFSKGDTVRPSHPFAREALWETTVVF